MLEPAHAPFKNMSENKSYLLSLAVMHVNFLYSLICIIIYVPFNSIYTVIFVFLIFFVIVNLLFACHFYYT